MGEFDPDRVDLDDVRSRYAEERARRVGVARATTLDLTGELAGYRQDPYGPVEPREPLHDVVDAIVVGAGFGGLLTARALQQQTPLRKIRVVDRAGDFGGVWYWNRYPGAQCDVESYIYLPLLEEVGTMPTERYASAPEIFAHAQAIGRRFDLYDSALFHTGVTGATWLESEDQWEVVTDRGDRMRTTYLVLAIGSLDKVKLPAIPGIESFAGRSFHTSRWDFDYTGGADDGELHGLADKAVGVVGTGATALQAVPHVGRWARTLHVFQRTPSTVDARHNGPTDPEWVAGLEPGWQAERMRNFTEVTAGAKVDRDLVDDDLSRLFTALLRPDPGRFPRATNRAHAAELADLEQMERIHARIDSTVADPRKAALLKPYYRYLCKRPGFHDDYLPTFNRPNVHVVDTAGVGLECVVADGVVVNGEHYPLDCLIWATGFETETPYVERIGFDLHGVGGLTLAEKWRDGMRTLHGITTHGFPNLLIIPGPNSQGTVTTNFTHNLSECAAHIGHIVGAVAERGATGFSLTAEAENAWVDTLLDRSRNMLAFWRSCTPGRFNHEGDPDGKSPADVDFGDGPLAYFDLLARWRADGGLPGMDLIRPPIRNLSGRTP
ncbi:MULTISPECIES: flavin-containing monooxygenase [unclassified Nocardioides]|uniref:flavin-containing monooxygenase n=1 Tax=unclassified Nocardioides TaxID=2615069 RepID=UPI003621A03C